MLSLTDIVSRTCPPSPWDEGDNIPWDDPDFSSRMLVEHLDQSHDLASRRADKIDAQVANLLAELPKPPARILDLACGPGLYLNRFAAAGYKGVGIDFSPASIDHAIGTAPNDDVEFRLDDLRTADFGSGFDAALLIYGQLNVFRRSEARSILERAQAALRPGGLLVLEPQTEAHIAGAADRAPSWSSLQSSIFCPVPHLLLTESFWDDEARASTDRFWVVDASSGKVSRYALSNEAYSEEELTALLVASGFISIQHRSALAEEAAEDTTWAVSAICA